MGVNCLLVAGAFLPLITIGLYRESPLAIAKESGAGFPACQFTGLSSPVFGGTGNWKVAQTRRLENLPNPMGHCVV